MSLRVTCPACGHAGHAPQHFLGRAVRCRKCGAGFSIAAEVGKLQADEDTIHEDAPGAKPPAPSVEEQSNPAQEESHT